MKVYLRHIFIFHNTFMIMSLLNDIVTLVLILHLQPHLSHDVPVNTLLKFFSYESFSHIFSKIMVSSCLIFQVFSRTLSPSFKTFSHMIMMPLKLLPAQQTNASGDFLCFLRIWHAQAFIINQGFVFPLFASLWGGQPALHCLELQCPQKPRGRHLGFSLLLHLVAKDTKSHVSWL